MTQPRRMTRLIIFLALGMLAVAADVPGNPGEQTHRPEAVIGAEDSVSILALNCDEISKTWRVSSAGDLNLPLVGSVRAGGMTVQQLEDTDDGTVGGQDRRAIDVLRVVAQDGRIDVALAHATRDDLRVLRTKIEDDNLFVHGIERTFFD